MKNSGSKQKTEPQIIPRPSHNVSRKEISNAALKVLYRLNKAGYQAFLVGGGVRDALLELHPKDFDIATDASPDEVRALFSNCRLIGRRFRLAHVRFGREIIEVATFRAASNGDGDHPDSALDTEGRILRDNIYGTIEEDVWRRDFTCNALYYNIADFSIWDYVGGLEDIKKRRLVLIGDADTRFREDPVRMLRAVRFAAKLDFKIEQSVDTAIRDSVELLRNVPPARLFDEFLKLFQAGHAQKTFQLLRDYKLFQQLFPETDDYLNKDKVFRQFVDSALINTDRRVAEGKSITPMFLVGVFLWAPVRERAEQLMEDEAMSLPQALNAAGWDLSGMQQSRISIPKRFTAPMREMLALQPRFEKINGRRALKLLEHRRFRAGYDFFVLRAEVGEADEQLAKFWTDVQTQSADERLASFAVQGGKKKSRRRRPRRKRAKTASS
ncbi:MAG: polynucleotide adenylyltransferase PcnB [Woeseia sp.]|nr:polynucleotide adenylyltransferase PcnB [Woeseia sp.]NNE61156.1 polynucleotide adenylyltransferase PcnB [Woeseia sp.]NNL56046.1 polynucleotide adenylyltransferase PcnB [Woeseia sp.]